jgi:hypothetical protein
MFKGFPDAVVSASEMAWSWARVKGRVVRRGRSRVSMLKGRIMMVDEE